MTETFPEWRERRLKELPPQSTETLPELLFVEVEVVTAPPEPGGRWTDMGNYYE